MTDQKSYRWKVLIATYLASFSYGVTLQSVPPVIPLLIKEFNLAHAQAGLAQSLFALPMIFLAIPAGLLADRWGPKKLGVLAFAFAVAGNLLAALSPSYPALLMGRALAGMGGLTLILISPQLISQWFLGRQLGIAMGIWNTAFPSATIVSFVTLGTIGQVLGWRGSMLVAVVPVAVSMVVFWLLARPAPNDAKHPVSHGSIADAIRRAGPHIWLLGAAWLFFNATTISFTSFGQDYFQSVGYSVAMAGTLSSMMLGGTLVAAPLVGILLGKGVRNEVLMVAGSLGLATVLFLVPANSSSVAPILLLGAVNLSLVVVSIFALPPTLMEPRLLGLGYGILLTCLNIGTALGPLTVGTVRDISGSYVPGFWAMCIMALMISAAAITLALSRNCAMAPKVLTK